jgi:magnesium transporter
MIYIYRKTLKTDKLEKIDNFVSGSWIILDNPTQNELLEIKGKFNLKKKYLLDALDDEEIPRLEIDKKNLYIFTKAPIKTKKGFYITTILFIITPNTLIVVSKKALLILKEFIEEKIKFYTSQRTKFLFLMILKINNDFKKVVKFIFKKVNILNKKIITANPIYIIKISRIEILLSDLLANLLSMNKIYETLLKKEYLEFLQEEKNIVDDLSLSTAEILEFLKSNLKRVQTLKNNYLAILNHQTNQKIQNLTIITIILFIPTIIFSLYGMNIKLPLQENDQALYIILFLSSLLMIMTFFIFNKKLK